MQFKIYKTYSPYSYNINIMYKAIEMISVFTLFKNSVDESEIVAEYLESMFYAVTFIDSENLVVTADADIDIIKSYSFLMYKTSLLFQDGRIFDLKRINCLFISNSNDNLMEIPDSDLMFTVQSVLDRLNLVTGMHRGYIQLINIRENQIYIKLHGTCSMCSLSQSHLKEKIKHEIRIKINKLFNINILPLSSIG